MCHLRDRRFARAPAMRTSAMNEAMPKAPITMRVQGGSPHSPWAGACNPKTPEISTEPPPVAKTTDAMSSFQSPAVRFGANLSAYSLGLPKTPSGPTRTRQCGFGARERSASLLLQECPGVREPPLALLHTLPAASQARVAVLPVMTAMSRSARIRICLHLLGAGLLRAWRSSSAISAGSCRCSTLLHAIRVDVTRAVAPK